VILFALGLALVLGGGIASGLLWRESKRGDDVFRFLVLAGCAVALVPALQVLFATTPVTLAPLFVGGRELPFSIDPLSAWFLLAVLPVGAAAAWYGVTYMDHGRRHHPVRYSHLLVALLLLGLAGVVTARAIIPFFAAWEVMALSSYLLIVFENEQLEVRRAGLYYIILTHTCTLALLCMFAAWTGGDLGVRFEALPALATLGAPAAAVILALALVGFGIKAGALPFHFWLPAAHSAAPSHVSAIMSGIVIKMGIYGLLRVLLLAGPAPAAWGWIVLGLGLASAVLGVLWALAQHDLKRLLAYHSVENIGIILMGLGLGVLGTAYGHPALALLGYAGALLHTLNHALFKSLLFLGAGAIGHATGTRELERLGGLLRSMPRTALAFLVGSAAIVGLPPLNGFVSEWLVFRGLLGTGTGDDGLRLACVAAVGLALTGALALACFTKLYGVTFLGNARDPRAVPAGPEPRGTSAPQLFLAALCVIIGVAPALLFPALLRAAAALMPEGVAAADAEQLMQGVPVISVVAVALIGAGALAWLARAWTLRGKPARREATWGCGFPAPTSRMQYTASSYAAPLLASFGPAAGSDEVRTPASFASHPHDLVLDGVGRPLWQRVVAAAGEMRFLHAGGMRWYLFYTVLTLLGLLLYIRFMGAA
jgi:formate hydrogenlyase subunit 3/multisubunit Na+/H+ antiporter MnhD subunit